jgi:hypothetical protein
LPSDSADGMGEIIENRRIFDYKKGNFVVHPIGKDNPDIKKNITNFTAKLIV